MNKKNIVMYQIGRFSTFASLTQDGLIMDIEDLSEMADKIVNNWVNKVDVKNLEEDGYIGAYAERVLHDVFLGGKTL